MRHRDAQFVDFALQKAHDRSWRQVYVVLRSQALLMYKDKKMALEVRINA